MHGTTLSFANMHNHGDLFANILHARREDKLEDDRGQTRGPADQDYDQYDTPQSRWLAVHATDGTVLAGVRLTPTTAQCGIYSYHIRDAQKGLLPQVSRDLIYDEAPVTEGTWELSRGFFRSGLDPKQCKKVRSALVHLLMKTAREEGIGRGLALLSKPWRVWARQNRLGIKSAGPSVMLGTVPNQATWIDLHQQLH